MNAPSITNSIIDLPAGPSLGDLLDQDPFQAYVYSYPHKTAYRTLRPARDLRDLWAGEDRSALFLYLHVPFCEQRCGFCNLFTSVQPRDGVVDAYLAALERQAAALARALDPWRVARMAVGGGTPTFLAPAQLERLLAVTTSLGAGPGTPCSVEVSPSTADAARVAVLAAQCVSRVSIGVQSVFPHETVALHRHQDPQQVAAALGALRDAGIPTVNADLIYGLPGQDAASLVASIDQVIAWGANELYLYPLYVRPLTTLGKRGAAPDSGRLELYRAARAHLRARGWRQATMRMFRADDAPDEGASGPRYRCQEDGMVGLGPGARSYTRDLHYASPYAVGQGAVRDLIARWSAQSEADFAVASHGFALDGDDQRRRWIMLSILEGGLDLDAYATRFGGSPLADYPHLAEAIAAGLVTVAGRHWHLSEAGMERSDVLGRWLYSPRVAGLMRDWTEADVRGGGAA